jgi:hypothetical protein
LNNQEANSNEFQTFDSNVIKMATVVSFSVLFDENGEATSELDKSTDKIRITLKGTETQIWGSICFFYGLYGNATQDPALYEIAFMEDRFRFFQDDIAPGEIAALGERYIIDLPDLGGVQFCTTNLPEFVSGMRAVPTEIRLKNKKIRNLRIIDHYRYIDLFRDDLYDLYTQTEEELDPFVDQPTLARVEATTIPPPIFQYEIE